MGTRISTRGKPDTRKRTGSMSCHGFTKRLHALP